MKHGGGVPDIYCSYKDFTGCGEWNAAKNAYDVHVPAFKDFGFTVEDEADFPAKMKRQVDRHLAAPQGTRLEMIALIDQTTDGFVGFIPDIDGLFATEPTVDELRYGLKIMAQGFIATFKRKKWHASSLSEIRNSRKHASLRDFLPVILVLEI